MTEPQVNLSGKERHKNVAGAFAVRNAGAFKGKEVLLVDDVYTTGATIRECARPLEKAGAKVFVLTLARAVKV
jgi:predicted amidophosphoribosyltransferase